MHHMGMSNRGSQEAGSGDPTSASVEVALVGGDGTEGVVRVGDTVRRPVGAHSALVHGVLGHLESVGFSGATRYLGLDEQGRDVLTYIPARSPFRPGQGVWPILSAP